MKHALVCVALHTGQGNSRSNDRYKSMNSDQRKAARDLSNEGEPGFGISACEYLASRDIALTMCDTSACDAQPSGEQGPDFSVPCHTEMQTRRGIWNLGNVDTKSLVDAKVLEGRGDGLARQPDGALLDRRSSRARGQALRNRWTPSASTARTARPSSSRKRRCASASPTAKLS